MAIFQLTFIFNAGRQGWSELFYVDRETGAEASASANAVGAKRKALIGKGTILEAIRVSNVDVFSDSFVDFSVGNTPSPFTADLVRDNPSNGWLVRCEAGTLYRRSMWLRGIPDVWIRFDSTDFRPIIDPGLLSNFDSWAAKAVTEGFKMRAFDKGVANPRKQITDLLFDGANGVIRVTVPGHGYSTNDQVHISTPKGQNAKQAKGVWSVMAPTTNTFDIRPKSGTVFLGPIIYTGSGLSHRQQFIYPTLNGYYLTRPAKKDTGSAFFVPRGRRRVVRT